MLASGYDYSMSISIPQTDLTLLGSTAIITPSSEWEWLISQLSSLVHVADFWIASHNGKPIPIGEVRALQYFAAQSPVGAKKIAVLPSLEELSPVASNALLKIVEEPPPYFQIVILSETDNFLPTLNSRLQILQFKAESATIDSKWKSALKALNTGESPDRRKIQSLLYAHSLTHTGINSSQVIDSFS